MLEYRLSICQNIEDYCNMRTILTRFKQFIVRLESINPYQYDGLIMQCLGGF